MGSTIFTKGFVKLGMVSLAAVTVGLAAQAQGETQRFRISQGSLQQALVEFTVQSQYQFMATEGLLSGKTVTPVIGVMSREEALQRLLEGTGLTYEIDRQGRVILEEDREKHGASGPSNSTSLVQYAAVSDAEIARQSNGAAVTNARNGGDVDETDGDGLEDGAVEEITVTGSNIRGTEPASQVFKYEREEIERTGLTTLPQFLRTLPQVFGGGAQDGNGGGNFVAPGSGAGSNVGFGSGVNLRGLGNRSTLVLLNGRRMAPAGFGEVVDISLIPLPAIDSVEVLPDGASALYGSDAVGGVVNFVLRDDYEGAQTQARYGFVTEGGLDELQLSQTFGKSWNSGHAMLSYEFFDRSFLDSEDRDFSVNSPDPTYLLPEQTRHSVFADVGQSLSDQVEVFATAFYSDREFETFTALTTSPLTSLLTGSTEQFGGTVGGNVNVGNDWLLEVAGTYNETTSLLVNNTFFIPFDPMSSPLFTSINETTSEALVIDAILDGPLFQMSGGQAKAAIGGQFRGETFQRRIGDVVRTDEDRDVYAVFAELNFPFISAENRSPGFERLELNIAARYEDYNDFGSSTDPRIGLVWSPVVGLKFRGTWGTSFKAPLLSELDETGNQAFLLDIENPDNPSEIIPGMIWIGNNSDLGTESATTWTAGVDITPVSVPGLSIEFTYYDIDFEDRITTIRAFLDGFSDPRFASLLTRNPNAELINSLSSLRLFENFSTMFQPEDTQIIFDRRLRNLATVQTNGLDFAASYGFDSDIGTWNVSIGGSYILEFTEQIFEADQPVDIVDTVFNPSDLRLNGAVSWEKDGFASNVQIRHTGAYRDVRETPAANVDSWTTVDLNLSYNTSGNTDSPWLRDTVFSISVQNLFDQNPPFVVGNAGAERNFDPENATSLNRFIAFQISRSW
ncbi:TonB-dependent receptor [Eilatimonas milleporae]|uniref:TonB-dependent receptor-like protein n=1 Tax=Eilatimonas milleporae TaxID=911205 RepID=A0A3M0CDB5_9PROT|nr:TonB-dependent receptor [Eilatimonas milleporae]RMB04989.1 TonB-dependent receptor-like protein [Eilatimonas milleporae]